MKLLLIEDDKQTAALLTQALTPYQFLVDTAHTGQRGLEMIQTYPYDLLVLDIVLPDIDGIQVCRQLRSEGVQIPILMLTAKESQSDRISGLEAGADDYVVKPYDLPELVARIRALLRRGGTALPDVLIWEKLRLEPSIGNATYDGKFLNLTKKEYGLLELLLKNPQRVFSRGMIIDYLWTSAEAPGEWTVTAHIKGLRQKLKTVGMKQDPIETLYGLGYRLRAPIEQPDLSEQSFLDQRSTEDRQVEALSEIASLWNTYEESLQTSFRMFEQTITQLTTKTLDPQLKQQAQQEAHRLIGSLGAFGIPTGAKVARQIEHLLRTFEQDAARQLSELVDTLRRSIREEHSSQGITAPTLPVNIAASAEETSASASVDREYHSLPQLLVISSHPTLIQHIQTEAEVWGLRVTQANTQTDAQAKIAQGSPDMILWDLPIEASELELSWLTERVEQASSIPLIILNEQLSLSDRITITQSRNKCRFLQKIATVTEILQVASELLEQRQGLENRVMIVDDDATVLEQVSSLLIPWGLQVIALQDPQQFWEKLVAVGPNLLIIDIKMPNINGLDLCQVVRNDVRWGKLPILVLSASTDAEMVSQVFTVGADDYVNKPIVAAELVARVLNRLEWVQNRRRMAQTRQTQ